MIIISEENWIAISRVFLDAFEQFWNKGTETQMIELNHRKIEISFFEQELCDPHRFNVILFRPDVDKIIESSFDQDTHDTTEIIQTKYQLAYLTKQPYRFRITTNNCEEEYEQIREILFNVYYDCSEEFSIADPNEPYVLKHMIELHGQKIFLHFTRGEMFNINGSIDVSIHCYPSDKECSGVICQDDPAPEGIIQMIRNLAWEKVTTVKQLIIAEYDDIYRIVEHFMRRFDTPSIGKDSLESLEYWVIKDKYLSQDPTATVPNVRFLTTAGIVDLYFFLTLSI